MRGVFAIIFAIVFLLLIQNVEGDAQEFDPKDIGKIEAELVISGSIDSTAVVKELNMSFYGLAADFAELKTYGEHFVGKTISKDEYNNSLITMQFVNMKSTSWKIIARIKNIATITNVGPVPYPIKIDFEEQEMLKYLIEGKNTRITDEIRKKAMELATGSGDAFLVVAKIADFVNKNVKYDKYYGDVTRGSDWVFVNKKGTCDEFANLFIAMARAAGIPARYVAGAVYSRDGWGYHGWAEVYLNAWVPVDPTWNEVGWLDATHIPFGKFSDSSEVLVKTTYIAATEVDVLVDLPKISVKDMKFEKIPSLLSINLTAWPAKIGPGDSSVIEVELGSTAGCLAVDLVSLPRVDKEGRALVTIDDNKTVVVCPKGIAHFIARAREELEPGFIYSNLLDIIPPFGDRITPNLTLDAEDRRRSTINLILARNTAELGEEIDFSVSAQAEYKIFSDMPVHENSIIAEDLGKHYVIAIAETGEVDISYILIKEELPFLIKDLRAPVNVVCGDEFNISFKISSRTERKISIIPFFGDGLGQVEPFELTTIPGREQEVVIQSFVFENCTGEDLFVSIEIGNQTIYAKIPTSKKEENWLAKLIRIFLDLIKRFKAKVSAFI